MRKSVEPGFELEGQKEEQNPTNDFNILQKFVHTKSGYNSMLCVQWSPSYCSVEKLVNKLSSHDNSHTVEARTVTYEGLEMYCKRDSISNTSTIYKHV